MRPYSFLLHGFPRSFTERHGEDYLQWIAEAKQESRYSGSLGRLRLFMKIAGDMVRAAPVEWSRSRRARSGGQCPGEPLRSLGRDLKYGVRTIWREPGFSALVILTLALGIGATSTVFSVLDAVVLRPLPYPQSERLLQVGMTLGDSPSFRGSLAPPDFFDLRRETRALDRVVASRSVRADVSGREAPLRLDGAGVTGDFFELLGAGAHVGRTFRGLEEERTGAPVAVISHRAWVNHFEADTSVVGESIVVNDNVFTLVGVLNEGFVPPEGVYLGEADIYVPLEFVNDDLTDRGSAFLQSLGRLKPGTSVEEARTELAALSSQIRAAHPETNEGRNFTVETLYSQTVGNIGSTIWMLFGAVGMLMLIACSNVANILLVRSVGRRREVALKTALGAGRARLVRELLLEVFVLATIGSVLGLGFAIAGVGLFATLNPGDIPRLAEVSVDFRVATFAIGVAVAFVLTFGLLPLVAGLRTNVSMALQQGSRSVSSGRNANRLRSALVVAEVALALVLVTGGGLLFNSFVRQATIDPGFDPENVVLMDLSWREAYAEPESRYDGFERVLDRIREIPGVVAAGATDDIPLGRNLSSTYAWPEGREPQSEDDRILINRHTITDGLMEALGMEIVRGDARRIHEAGQPMLLVNEYFWREYFVAPEPVGSRIKFGRPSSSSPFREVVAVAGDIKQERLTQDRIPEAYISHRFNPRWFMTIAVRVDGNANIANDLREAVWAVDPAQPVGAIRTMTSHIASSVAEPKFYAVLLTVFGSLAFLLASVGVFGTISYSVSTRRPELAVRMALGASSGGIQRLVLASGMKLTVAGVTLGLLGALWLSGYLSDRLFEVSRTDPLTLATATAVVALSALAACYLPALKASRVNPMRTLQSD